MAISSSIAGTAVHVGDLIRLHLKVMESGKERTQIFEGLVIGIRGRGENRTFTVRKIAAGGIGVERIFPVNSPWISKVDVKKHGTVRRAKLHYVRGQSARRVARITQTVSK
ncbi:50S ribosomal protein L19 [Candidatus Amesbacteria bacterium RIFCSPLOWO2_02_FULL_48_11]|uniref:50S ribosomal protein L19 n=3 Tax=Candidatus Amesiibacteriota TaxID=1752730 RepID=A0A1F4Z5H3_9BACT|nr:MAG: 50S ribosomal protein L19, large subunit ribosomal protein L19 [Candidatus Amesbacteria bacterium GW2011_GWC1_48_10]OGC91481.1 MAG: 50S ribosomal protein L19 [Candidatus Amesbacteria bacterium RBG_19FT_COMBO_48_16]OGC96704.1 MAG: 50S ribosomal protein L19 [Candidatus Amesbacteria bacterium RIFCSPHIGHO2_02_FULL_48_21]OGD01378.1 MAG: 50S ribosomal protein L19 [Candidatus Amesbacteria bacterium RIFCSPHIGHO2_12_FULL_48_14]OGD02646.1 MAG: 50S ribosomal protein L19 [Candidatus Amesbacteria ba